jgi:photosystem II stability/assembly factor-like uncharacterized protein
MAICLSQNGATIFRSKAPSNEIFVATAQGVVTIERESNKKWLVKGRALENCHIGSITIEPSQGVIFAGAHKGTVYASADGGKTWEPRNKGITFNDIFSLASVKVGSGSRIYAGTEPAHLFVSEDLGASWRELPSLRDLPTVSEWNFPAPPHIAHVKNVTFDPRDPDTIYASVEQGGLFKSVDAGASWEELSGFYYDVHRLVIRPSNPDWFYITGGEGLYRSKDGGNNWEHVTHRQWRIGYPDALLLHPGREELMFMAGSVVSPSFWPQTKSADTRIARSRDHGDNWELLTEGFAEHMKENVEAMALEAWDRSCAVFAGTTAGDIYLSEDEGDHWTKIVSGIPAISKHGHYSLLKRVAA